VAKDIEGGGSKVGSVRWRRSTRCNSSGCVELAEVGSQIVLRDSRQSEALVLTLNRSQFACLVEAVKEDASNGESETIRLAGCGRLASTSGLVISRADRGIVVTTLHPGAGSLKLDPLDWLLFLEGAAAGEFDDLFA